MTYIGSTHTAVEASSTSGLFSTKTFTLSLTPDPDIDPFEIGRLADDLTTFEARVLGRAHDLEGDFDNAAQEFTEIIKWDISSLKAEDLDTWMQVSASIRYCTAVTDDWVESIKEYKRERYRVISDWNSQAPTLAEGLDEAPSGISFVWSESPAEKAEAALYSLKTELEARELEAFQTFNEKAEEIIDDLTEGPTPETIQRLIDGGHMKWSYFNLGADVEALPIDMDPEDAADRVTEFSDDPDNYDGDISEIAAILSNIGVVAASRQENGGTTSSEELAFLTEFYEALEEAGGSYSEPPGVLNITDNIRENSDSEISEHLLGGLGDGILALSDERLLGSYERLPQSIREATEGPKNENSFSEQYWNKQAGALAGLLEHANPDLQGGEQFSVNLTQSLAHHLDQNSEDSTFISEEELETLLEASTRNEDANHAILTGEGHYEHPDHGLDTDTTLSAIFSHDWPDRSNAVTGLTDWIWEQADGNEGEQVRAAEAAVSLIEALSTANGEESSFLNTGHAIDGNSNAAITELNPALAESFSKIFLTHIDSFGASHTGPNSAELLDSDSAASLPLFEAGDIILNVSADQKQEFIQLLLANEEVSPNILISVVDHEHRTLEAAIFDRSESPRVYGNESALLRSLTENAMVEEIQARTDNNIQAEDDAKKEAEIRWMTAYKTGSAIASGGIGAIPVAGNIGGIGVNVTSALLEEPFKNFATEQIEQEMEEFRSTLEASDQPTSSALGGDDRARWHVSLQVAHVLITEGVLSPEDFADTRATVEDSNGASNIPQSISEWGNGHSTKADDIMEVIAKIPESELQGSNVSEIVEEYIDGYQESFNE